MEKFKKLLDLKGAKSLTVPKMEIDSFEITYDFANKLVYKKLDSSENTSAYIISKELANAVNAAIITGRPLLLRGEPGCGKTQLAKAIAVHFYKGNAEKYYFEWHVKSKSKAREGGYTFDHVSRLRDATISGKDDDKARAKVGKAQNYITLGPMGQAFVASHDKLPILLIDEIDKGDIDFPNDLLLELDEMRFRIDELTTSNYIIAHKARRPLVIISSNDERELPPAFLRRCLYYEIPAFGKELLEKIANSKVGDFYEELSIETNLSNDEKGAIVAKFLEVKEKNTSGVKPPSTSEFLDWLKLIVFKLNENEELLVEDVIDDPDFQKLALKILL